MTEPTYEEIRNEIIRRIEKEVVASQDEEASSLEAMRHDTAALALDSLLDAIKPKQRSAEVVVEEYLRAQAVVSELGCRTAAMHITDLLRAEGYEL